MKDHLERLFSAWGNPSPDDRAAVTDAVIGPEFYYADPNTSEPLSGREAYLDYVAQFGEMMPGVTAEVVAVSDHHGHARATVAFHRDGKQMMRGQYFADAGTDGRIARLVGFVGMGEPE